MMIIIHHVIGENTKEVTEALKNSSIEIIQWFSNNQMKVNADKYHFLTSSNKESTICIDNNIILNTKCEKILGVKIVQKLNFNAHINDICKKAGQRQKLSAFFGLPRYIDIQRGAFY